MAVAHPTKKKLITYWEFVIRITGPRLRTKAERRRVPSRRLRRQVEERARRAAAGKLPPGFRAAVY